MKAKKAIKRPYMKAKKGHFKAFFGHIRPLCRVPLEKAKKGPFSRLKRAVLRPKMGYFWFLWGKWGKYTRMKAKTRKKAIFEGQKWGIE